MRKLLPVLWLITSGFFAEGKSLANIPLTIFPTARYSKSFPRVPALTNLPVKFNDREFNETETRVCAPCPHV